MQFVHFYGENHFNVVFGGIPITFTRTKSSSNPEAIETKFSLTSIPVNSYSRLDMILQISILC